MSSPLMLAMLSQGQTQGQDPATAMATARMGLASKLMEAGTSDAPTNRAGMFSRLAQALVGGYIGDTAQQGLNDAYKNLGPSLAQTLPQGHPLIGALTSDNPMVRFNAVQAWQKMMPMLGSPERTAPGTSLMLGNGQVVGTGPGPQSDPGKIAHDTGIYPGLGATVAGVEGPIATAKAAGEGAGGYPFKAGLQSHQGAVDVGVTNAEVPAKQAVQNNQANLDNWLNSNKPVPNTPAGTDVGPARGAPLPPPVGLSGVPNAGALSGDIPGAVPQLSAHDAQTIAALTHRTPGALPPLPTGTMPPGPIPTSDTLPPGPGSLAPTTPMSTPTGGATPPAQPLSGQTAGVSPFPPPEIMGTNAKRFSDLATSASTARQEVNQALMLQQNLNGISATGGPATSKLAALSRLGAQVGIPQETLSKYNLGDGAKESEAEAQANELAMEIARTNFPGRVTNTDLATARSTKPNPDMPLAASNYLINNVIVPNSQRTIDRYNSVAGMGNPAHPSYSPGYAALDDKLNSWDNAHPFSSYVPTRQSSPEDMAAAALRSRPDMAAQYEAKFGPGSAAKVLGQ